MKNYETKKRYKMYKVGKNWIVISLVFMGLAIGVNVDNFLNVQADTVIQNKQANNDDTIQMATVNNNTETPIHRAENATEKKDIDGHWYLVDNETKENLKGFQEIKQQNKVVYYDNDKAQMQYGWQNINNNQYYFDTFDGAMAMGQKKINNDWYLFNNQGVMQTGFQRIADQNKTVYYSKDGKMQYGQQKINNNWYNFDTFDGAMKTGLVYIPEQNKTVYYATNGQMQYGQQKINNTWYMFDTFDGAMQTGFKYIPEQNKTVYYAANGQMQYGWQNINNKTYYFDKVTGAMKTGTENIDGKKYTFKSDGVLQGTWGWPFPAIGEGRFTGAQLFGVNYGGGFRINGFHDGLDFGSFDHPGSAVHAVHGGVVTHIGYMAGLEHYVVVQSDEYSFVYQEAFANRGNINVYVGQQINTGDVIGYRTTSHLHLGITREKNIMRAFKNSFNNNGTWLNPLALIKNGMNN